MDFTRLAPSEIENLAEPNKDYLELLKTKPRPDLDYSDPANVIDSLRYFNKLQDRTDRKDPEVGEETFVVSARDGHQLPVKVFQVATSTEQTNDKARPLIVLYFGGGFCFGTPTSMSALARSLAKRFNAVVATPTYRLAPEHPFPTGVEDGQDTLEWLARNALDKLHADPFRGFVVGGISAGGNITNVITHLARDSKMNPPVTGNWLSVAGVRLRPDDEEKLPQKYRERFLSRTQESCINAGVINPNMRKLLDDSLKPDWNSKLYAPLIWPTESGHNGMPKTYSQVCGLDPGRDELLIYDDMLKNEGIETKLDLYPGLPHAFWHPFKELQQSKQWEIDTRRGFAWLLGCPED